MKKLVQRFRPGAPFITLAVLFFGAWLFDHSPFGLWFAAAIMVGYFVQTLINETK